MHTRTQAKTIISVRFTLTITITDSNTQSHPQPSDSIVEHGAREDAHSQKRAICSLPAVGEHAEQGLHYADELFDA